MEQAEARTGVHWTAYALLASSLLIFVGVHWDISWHRTIGRDTFWTPAHLGIQGGGILAGASCAWAALASSTPQTSGTLLRGVRIFGITAPLGAWIAIWGTVAMLTSAPLDDWWHAAYGLDVTILSPPHILLAAGIVAIQVGACLVALSWKNRSDGAARRYLAWLFTMAAGLLTAVVAIVFTERFLPNLQHGTTFYLISAGFFPAILSAVARSGDMRLSATAVAGVYMGFTLIMMWILPLFPGDPMLAPVLREVTHFVPPPFPLLLIAPALAVDIIEYRASGRAGYEGRAGRGGQDWGIAALGGLAFVSVFLASQWPFSEFLLSDGSRNYLFQGHSWGFDRPPGAWETTFWHGPDGFSAAAFWRAMPLAVLLAFGSARVGLWIGNWLIRVRR